MLDLLGEKQGLRQDFITGCPNWDFMNLGCPKSLIEKVKIITLKYTDYVH